MAITRNCILLVLMVVLACITSGPFYGFAECKLVDGFCPPSVPIVVQDPLVSVWSNTNNLADSFVQ